ncbi:MAG: transglutaminase domain-containing protein [Clostridia bacterium]|nr:transglutaminase domain-containing protein [Clostridia bacterium]
MTKSNLIKLICLMIIIAVTVVASVLLLGFLQSEGVLANAIVIESGSATRVYDGNPLTESTWNHVSGKLATGHILFVEVTGSQTEIGSSPNIFTVTIKDSTGNDVTNKYSLILKYGQLTVTEAGEDGLGGSGDLGNPIDGMFGSLDMSGGLTGSMEGMEGDMGMMDMTVYFTLNSSISDTVYLRMMSFGDYDGKNSFKEATEYGALTEDGYSAYYITALALQNSGLSTNTLNIEPNGGTFALPYYTLDGSIEMQGSDVTQTRDQTESYYVNYYNWDNVAGVVLPAKYRSYEEEYREFVYENYLDLDRETDAYMQTIIDKNSFSASSPDIISRVAKYIQTAAVYNLKYPAEMDESSNMIIAFLDEYKEGVCRHYAASAVALFRALGIPARYTIGFVGNTIPGQEVAVTAANYHAWVEVYVDGIGWVNVEVTGSGGPSEEMPIKLTVLPEYTGAQFDSSVHTEKTPLTPNQKVRGLSNLEAQGYTYEVEISGENYALGTVASEITELKIYDPLGQLVYQKSTGVGNKQFLITYLPGQLQLYYSILKFSSSGLTKVYDGESYEVSNSNCYLINGQLQSGFSYSIHSGSVLKNIGRYAAGYKVTVLDGGGVDRTDFYKIDYSYGTVEISAIEITVTAGSASKKYDGSALTCNEIIYNSIHLAIGDTIVDYTVSGSQINVGKSSNVVKSVTIVNSEGEDVTGNYIVKMAEGVLTVEIP